MFAPPADEVESRRSSEVSFGSPTKANRGIQLSPPIVVVILATAFMSSAASMAGGLVMYFNSLESLRATIEETSRGEVQEVRASIQGHFTLVQEVGTSLSDTFTHTALAANDTRQWVDAVRTASFSRVKHFTGMYSSGVTLIPHDPLDSDSLYAMVWADPLQGGREFQLGHYGLYLNRTLPYFNVTMINSSTGGTPEPRGQMPATTDILNSDGSTRKFSWDSFDNWGYLYLLGNWTPGDSGLPPTYTEAETPGWQKPPPGNAAAALKWRPPGSVWYSSDGTYYTYGGVDFIYAPPPAPHPWSHYKAVVYTSLFLYSEWGRKIAEYAKTHLDTDVIVLDRVTLMMYAATTGENMLKDNCTVISDFVCDCECVTRMSDMSPVVQEAYAILKKKPTRAFMQRDLLGTAYYIRREHVFDTVELIWLRKTSVGKEKVRHALNLLIVFTVLVLVFDLLLCAVEVLLIGLPLRRLSSALHDVGSMRVTEARAHVARYESTTLMISEIRSLMLLMLKTTSSLGGYRSFVPDAVLEHSETAQRTSIAAPSGTVTILFTDVVRSTDLWEAIPSAMARALDLHNSVMRQELDKYQGYEVKTIGDAFMIAFHDPLCAVRFGAAVQAELLKQEWPEALLAQHNASELKQKDTLIFRGLRVRMGAHVGASETEVNPVSGRIDYRGPAVNKAARLESASLPGILAVSEELRDLVLLRKTSGEQTSFELMARKNLKGIGETPIFFPLKEPMAGRMAAHRESARGAPSSPILTAKRDSPSSVRTSKIGSARVAGREDNAAFERRLKKVDGSCVTVKMSGVTETMLLSGEAATLFAVLNGTLQTIIDVASMMEGKVEALVGNVVTATWNLATQCVAYQRQALRFVGMVQRKAGGLHLGLCVGPIYQGAAGTSSRRYHSIVGVGLYYSRFLAALAAERNVGALYLQRGLISDSFAHCGFPVEVMEGVKEYAPVLVIEQLLEEACVNLKIGWADQFDLASLRQECPGLMYRSQLWETVTRHTGALREVDVSHCAHEEAAAAFRYLTSKPVLVTPASLQRQDDQAECGAEVVAAIMRAFS